MVMGSAPVTWSKSKKTWQGQKFYKLLVQKSIPNLCFYVFVFVLRGVIEVYLGALGNSWGHLGPLGHPESQQNTKNHRSLDPPPPSWSHLGAQVGLMLGHVWQKSVSKHSWKTCCFKTSFFNENWSPKAPPRTPKIKQNHSRVFKINGFRLFNISGSWDGSWGSF